jgi:PKHD-type hydroxylase
MSVHVLRAVLSPSQLARARAVLERGPWLDGRHTAGTEAARIKRNRQLDPASGEYTELAELTKQVLQRSEPFKQLALPRKMSAPIFSRYDEGMEYGPHTDDAYRARESLRTDLSATLFLSERESYEGGELVIGETPLKPEAGDAVIYPSTTVHRVARVERGARLACVFWIQSLVRAADEREILSALANVISQLKEPRTATLALANVQQNLLRKWLDP